MSFTKATVCAIALTTSALTAIAGAAAARDNVQVAGSSTVLPYASIIAEAFGDNTDFPTPVVESGGSSAGLKRFCEGVGANTIDVANASRQIKSSEIEACAANGVTDIIEVRIGYDGIVFASDIGGQIFAFTPSDWFNALAPTVLKDGVLVDNPNTDWSQVNTDFASQNILALIPGTKHGTREVFEEKVLLVGCEDTGAMAAMVASGMSEDDAEDACLRVRNDGLSVDIDGDYTETLARLEANKAAVGVFGLSFFENNTDKLQAATMSGVAAETATIASGEYPVSRPLFFYVKKAHIGVIPGLKEYTQFFVADELAGPDGPLATYGLVSDPELADTQAAVNAEQAM